MRQLCFKLSYLGINNIFVSMKKQSITTGTRELTKSVLVLPLIQSYVIYYSYVYVFCYVTGNQANIKKNDHIPFCSFIAVE